MYKGTNEIANKGLGFKLTNSMSLGESVISAGYIQKTIKGDLHVRGNLRIPPQELRGKTLEDSKRLSTEAHPEGIPCGADQPVGSPHQPLVATLVSHHLLSCISAIP
jgi:hypothetical protein